MKTSIFMLALIWAMPSLAAEPDGAAVFQKWCAPCHDAGVTHPGTQMLAVTRGADKAVIAERKDLAPVYIRFIIRNGLRGMTPFRPTEVSDADIDSLIKFLQK